MRSAFVEQLEERQLLSTGIGAVEPRLVAAEPALTAPLLIQPVRAAVKRMPRVGDVFKGWTKWHEDGHAVTAQVTLRIIRAGKNGVYKARGTSADDKSALYTYTVHLKTNGTFTFSFTGHNYYGADTGSGSGRLSADGKTLTGSNTSSQGSNETFKNVLQ